ncbi:MAG TPA: SPW repeat protein [Gemmatimonadales bacterium]|nr:SPW repeat protein [Gemmatimonadales bacterium]
MRVIPTRIHGMLDYLVGALLVAAPWLFDFDRGGAETWIPVLLGIGALVYSLFTDYELGLVRRIPMPTHLRLDLISGILLALSPWLFGFSDHVARPHVVLGLFEIGAALLTSQRPSTVRAGGGAAGMSNRRPRTSGATGG